MKQILTTNTTIKTKYELLDEKKVRAGKKTVKRYEMKRLSDNQITFFLQQDFDRLFKPKK